MCIYMVGRSAIDTRLQPSVVDGWESKIIEQSKHNPRFVLEPMPQACEGKHLTEDALSSLQGPSLRNCSYITVAKDNMAEAKFC